MKQWLSTDIYNMSDEFNRIEEYNQYIENWLKNYFDIPFVTLTHNTNWNYNDIVDVNDFNRIKSNINEIAKVFDYETTIKTSTKINQVFNFQVANDIETYVDINIELIGNGEFRHKITGLSTCGLELNIMEEL